MSAPITMEKPVTNTSTGMSLDIKKRMAAGQKTQAYVLDALGNDPDPAVRKIVAGNLKTPPKRLKQLAASGQPKDIRDLALATLQKQIHAKKRGHGKFGAAKKIFFEPGQSSEGVDKKLAAMIDHAALKADTTTEQIQKLCAEAKKYKFASVCVAPSRVELAAELLKGTNVKVGTVIGFPLGAATTMSKISEVRDAIANGAQELDMVINVGALKDGNYKLVDNDIREVVKAANGRPVKVIIEACLLTHYEKISACLIAKSAGADFVKTSTGFSSGGATPEDISLMRNAVGEKMGIKAAGGIRDRAAAQKLVEAGATRIGASASVAIVTTEPKKTARKRKTTRAPRAEKTSPPRSKGGAKGVEGAGEKLDGFRRRVEGKIGPEKARIEVPRFRY